MVGLEIDHSQHVPKVLVAVGEVVGWIRRPLKDEIPSYRLELEDQESKGQGKEVP